MRDSKKAWNIHGNSHKCSKIAEYNLRTLILIWCLSFFVFFAVFGERKRSLKIDIMKIGGGDGRGIPIGAAINNLAYLHKNQTTHLKFPSYDPSWIIFNLTCGFIRSLDSIRSSNKKASLSVDSSFPTMRSNTNKSYSISYLYSLWASSTARNW